MQKVSEVCALCYISGHTRKYDSYPETSRLLFGPGIASTLVRDLFSQPGCKSYVRRGAFTPGTGWFRLPQMRFK